MDDARFEMLYAEHAARVLAWCRFALGSPTDAEDAAAETFARLLASGDGVRDEAVPAWLFTVSRRVCADVGRRAARERTVAVVPEDAAAEDPPDVAWSDPRLRDALRSLTPLQRQVLFLRVIEDLPFAEVARLSRRSGPAVRMAHHRALKALASHMRGSEDDIETRTHVAEARG